MLNESIFKSYDVRGVYPSELNAESAYIIGRAFAIAVGADTVVVGSDMRVSGPALKKELIRGITDQGVKVVDLGLVPIDAVYFAVSKGGYNGGVMITASHNPKEYNGFKMVRKDALAISGKELLETVKELPAELTAEKAEVEQMDIFKPYVEHVLSFADLDKIKPFKVVVDAGNGMSGIMIPKLEPHLPIKIIPMNFELDGNFPAHPSNPLLPESQAAISQKIKDEKADFGVIFDGDTDRLVFLDENGEFIQADITLLVLAKEFLKREPGRGIVYNAVCSKIVSEKVAEWGGKPIRSRVGYFFVTQAMRNNDGIMGGELSSHYSFRDNSYADSGFIAFLILLQLVSEDGRPLSEIVKEFQKYYKAPETNLEIDDKEGAINAVKEKYSDGRQDELDGLTVAYDNWWFNVRPSNTEPLLRVTVEADTQELLNQKSQELIEFINNQK